MTTNRNLMRIKANEIWYLPFIYGIVFPERQTCKIFEVDKSEEDALAEKNGEI